jgi:hypothetical protein
MLNHKKDTALEGRIREGFKERQHSLDYKRQDLVESLSVETAALGIFDSLTVNEIRKLIMDIVEKNPIDMDFNLLKSVAIQKAIELNQQKKEKKAKPKVKDGGFLPLLSLRTKALKKKQHPYEFLKASGYIKNPLQEFYE